MIRLVAANGPSMPMLLKLALMFSTLLTATALIAQPIYKLEDRDGNIIYTDEKPAADAEPIELPELGVLGEDSLSLEALLEAPLNADEPEPLLLLGMTRPIDGMELIDSGEGVEVELHSGIDLPPSTQIVLYINDQPQEPIHQLAVALLGLAVGAHRVRAELQTPSGRILARTEEVAFILRPPLEGTPTP